LLVLANCGVLILPVFYIIKDYIQTKKPELPTDKGISESQPQQNQTEKLPEEILPKVTSGEKFVIKSKENSVILTPKNEDPEVSPEFTSEIKIGKIVSHTRKDSIDNFTIMQSSGAGLLSPYNSSSISGLLSPLQASSILLKLPTPKENIIGKEDLMFKTPRQKKINLKRINMKQFVVDEMKLKSEGLEKIVTERMTTKMTEPAQSTRTQGDNESENLINAGNSNKLNSNDNK